MLKHVIVGVVFLSVFAPLTAVLAGVPQLSGSYIYTGQRFCQLDVTVTYGTSPSISGSPFVKQVVTPAGGGPNTIGLSAGTFKFTLTGAGAGTVSINGFQADGSAILIKSAGSGGGGTDGAPLGTETETGSGTFKQTATTLTIKEGGGTDSYHIYYGKVVSGVVQDAVTVGIDGQGCAEQYTVTHS